MRHHDDADHDPFHLAAYEAFAGFVAQRAQPRREFFAAFANDAHRRLRAIGERIAPLAGTPHHGIRIDRGTECSEPSVSLPVRDPSAQERLEWRFLAEEMLDVWRSVDAALPGLSLDSMAAGGHFAWIEADFTPGPGRWSSWLTFGADGRDLAELEALTRLPYGDGPLNCAALCYDRSHYTTQTIAAACPETACLDVLAGAHGNRLARAGAMKAFALRALDPVDAPARTAPTPDGLVALRAPLAGALALLGIPRPEA